MIQTSNSAMASLLSMSWPGRERKSDCWARSLHVMAGLVPAIHVFWFCNSARHGCPAREACDRTRPTGAIRLAGHDEALLVAQPLNQGVVEIVPMRVGRQDEPHFPSARPVLHRVLALD